MGDWGPGSSHLKMWETEAQIGQSKSIPWFLCLVAEPGFGARLCTATSKQPCPFNTHLQAVFTLRSQQPSFPWPPSSSPKVPKWVGGWVIFTSRVGKGAKAEAGANQWRQLRLKYRTKLHPANSA